ncbi:MAG: hydrolase, alpha/beta fold family protein [Ilumatobacteraceae bacterium]|nr:hydrolase, alpha/beta fold family protein [Ilumatobacteraceae bacterium]
MNATTPTPPTKPRATASQPASIVRFAGHDGVHLEGDLRGDAHDPLVVLLHGGGQTRHAWASTAAVLASTGWQTLALDARGHGRSDWDEHGDYSLTAFARDVEAVVAQLACPRPVLIGASLGGMTSLLLEGELSPGFARAVALVDIAPRMEQSGATRIHSFMSKPDGFASLDEAADAIAAYNPHRPRPADLAGLAKNLRQTADGRWHWHWDPRFITGRGPGELADHGRMEACARSLVVPTLLVRGRMSDILSEAGAQEMLALVPHADYVDVSGAGHMVVGDRNEAFTVGIVEFLDRVRDNRSTGRSTRTESA